MTRRFLAVFGLFLSLVMASTPLVAAQSDPDVAAIGDTVNATDTAALVAALEVDVPTRDLPDGFTEAAYVDINTAADAASQTCMYDASSVEVEGAAGYILTVDAEVIPYQYACASINYLAFDPSELGDDPLGDFKRGVEQGLAESATPAAEGTPVSGNGEGSVSDITVAGEDAILITYTLEQDGAHVVVQTIAIPVGNVFVIALVSVGDTAEIDPAEIETLANNLTVAAIVHLGNVAEDAQ